MSDTDDVKARMARARAVRDRLINEQPDLHDHRVTFMHGNNLICACGELLVAGVATIVPGKIDEATDAAYTAFADSLETDPCNLNAALWAALRVARDRHAEERSGPIGFIWTNPITGEERLLAPRDVKVVYPEPQPERAQGGPVPTGRTYTYGERGPEDIIRWEQ